MFLWLTNFRQNGIDQQKHEVGAQDSFHSWKNGRVGRNLSEPCHSAFTGNANPKCRFECSRVTAPTAAKCPEIRWSALKNRNNCWQNKISDYQDSLFFQSPCDSLSLLIPFQTHYINAMPTCWSKSGPGSFGASALHRFQLRAREVVGETIHSRSFACFGHRKEHYAYRRD